MRDILLWLRGNASVICEKEQPLQAATEEKLEGVDSPKTPESIALQLLKQGENSLGEIRDEMIANGFNLSYVGASRIMWNLIEQNLVACDLENNHFIYRLKK